MSGEKDLESTAGESPAVRLTTDLVLAIDPGSAKCGIAVVGRDEAVSFRDVIPTENLIAKAIELVAAYQPEAVIIGGGTGSKPLIRMLREQVQTIPVLVVDEAYTSEMARARFVVENPARGLQRLLPRSLRYPDRPYDDYVAVVLAERFWRQTDADRKR
jgi:RNase H-fold protein (predicted Holliday junction resolvase)